MPAQVRLPIDWPLPAQYGFALTLSALALAVRLWLDPMLGDQLPFALAFGALLLLVATVRPGPFLLASALAALGSWYLFIPPRYSFVLEPLSLTQLLLFAAVAGCAALACGFAARAQDQLKRAQREADARREALRVTLESIGDAVIATDPLGRVEFLNPEAVRLTACSLPAAQGQPLEEVFPIVAEDTGRPVENPVDRVLRTGAVVGLGNHTLLRSRDGREWPIDDSAAPIRDRQGRITGVVLVFRDISARRAAEQRLARSERELADFFENVEIGLHWVGPDGTILRANRAELKMLGYSADEYIGRKIVDFHDDPTALASVFDCLEAGKTVHSAPARMRCKDGSVRDVLISSSAYVEDGRFVHSRCVTLDITERKRAEEALRASEQRFRLMADAAPVLVWMSGPDAQCTWFNQGWLDFTGSTLEAELGEGWLRHVHPDDQAHCLQVYRSHFEARQPFSMEYRLRHHGGAWRWVVDYGVPLYEEARFTGYIGTCTDITDRKAAEEERERLLAELRRADRRKDEFLATLAHELRNPLAPIQNSLEILRRAGNDGALIAPARATMQRQLSHMVRLIDDLLDLNRISRDRLELRRSVVDLREVLQQAAQTVDAAFAAKSQRFTLALPQQPLPVDADPMRLAQVFINLLNNAGKFTPAGGRIELTAAQCGSDAEVVLRDNGVGIAAEHLPQLFEMFAQAAPAPGETQAGLGIGLALARRLVQLHGGSITASSDGPGRGSSFTVRLALTQAALAAAPAPASAVDGGNYRVLVVDDNRDAAESLALLLSLSGQQTRTAFDGLEAIQVAQDWRPEVVLLDIGLPKLNGYEVARRLRALPDGGALTLVALTGWGQEDDRRRSREAGFDGHLIKPVDHAELMQLLARLRQERRASA